MPRSCRWTSDLHGDHRRPVRRGTGQWAVALGGGGAVTELHPRHVVLATGVFGAPHRLEIPGAEHFTGRLLHATEYTDRRASGPW